MSRKFKTREEVAEKIEVEGLDYFLLCYCTADAMPDQELVAAFARARDALEEFKKLIPEIEY